MIDPDYLLDKADTAAREWDVDDRFVNISPEEARELAACVRFIQMLVRREVVTRPSTDLAKRFPLAFGES